MFNVIKENGIEIPREQLPDRFGTFFFNKVKNLTDTIHARDDVYNGKKKVESTNRMFMDLASVKECMLSLKIKNTEGFDRIPQRILVDGADVLDRSFANLFKKIYEQKAVPGQWLISKTISIYNS